MKASKVGVIEVYCHIMVKWNENYQFLYADDAPLLVEWEKDLDKVMDRCDDVCKRQILKVNADKSKTFVFERNGMFQSDINLNVEELGAMDD